MSVEINSEQARERPWTRREILGRFLWGCVYPFFRLSPRSCFRWRVFLLKIFGARIGKQVHIYNSSRIMIPWHLEVGNWSTIGDRAEIYNLGKIRIGSKVTISQRAHLCAGTHDHQDPNMPLLKKGIVIGDQAWICADAFIGPDSQVGEGAVVGACAVLVKSVAAWKVVAGNPARVVGERILSKGKCNQE